VAPASRIGAPGLEGVVGARRGLELGEQDEVVRGEDTFGGLVEDDSRLEGLTAELAVGSADVDVVDAAGRFPGPQCVRVGSTETGRLGCSVL
jgi:hypothetical protein